VYHAFDVIFSLHNNNNINNVETKCKTVLYSKHFDKQLTNFHYRYVNNVSYCGTHRANSQSFWDWEAEENGKDKGKGGYG